MRSALVLLIFLVMSCQEQTDSNIASGTEQSSNQTAEQFYFAGFYLQPVQSDETSSEEQTNEAIKVVIKVSVNDSKPISLLIKKVTQVADLSNPTNEEVPEEDGELLPLAMPDPIGDDPSNRIGHKGSRKYLASHGVGPQAETYELHWFNGTWGQFRKLGDSQEHGPISDTTVARFVVRIGDIEYANVDDSFEDSLISFANRLPLSAEEIAEKYFGIEDDVDLLAHRQHENLSATEQCGESLKPYIGYNVYRIERTSCQSADEQADDGALLVKTSIGVARHLTGIDSSDGNTNGIMCLIPDDGGLTFSDNNEALFSSTDCDEQLIDIKAYMVGSVSFLEIKAKNDEERVVWLKNNKVSNAQTYGEALLTKYEDEAKVEIDQSASTETTEESAEEPEDDDKG